MTVGIEQEEGSGFHASGEAECRGLLSASTWKSLSTQVASRLPPKGLPGLETSVLGRPGCSLSLSGHTCYLGPGWVKAGHVCDYLTNDLGNYTPAES